jgi:hypothetical protein
MFWVGVCVGVCVVVVVVVCVWGGTPCTLIRANTPSIFRVP